MTGDIRILLVGLGGFGCNHLKAWHELGFGNNLYVSELDAEKHRECRLFNLGPDRVTTDFRRFLDDVDVVDVVTPSTSHFALCSEVLRSGKHVFVEKPMTMTSAEALELSRLVRQTGRMLQVGYYYRFHPISAYVKEQIRSKRLGALRYLSGNFMGFKRARTDVGVTHTDAVHFLDLFNWFVGSPPVEAYAVTRDHFGRGMEDYSVVHLRYADGTLAKVESGYIQPGKWRDKVVPDAFTSKEFFICGSEGTLEADFETEEAVFHNVKHEFREGTWRPIVRGSEVLNLGTASPIKMICAELDRFLDSVRAYRSPQPDVVSGGVVLAKLMEAIYKSAGRNAPTQLSWTDEENSSLQ